jgi:sec-independent protein translocase protein TatA
MGSDLGGALKGFKKALSEDEKKAAESTDAVEKKDADVTEAVKQKETDESKS